MYPRHPEHLKAFDYIGFYRYFLTFCTFYRRRLFTSAERVELVRTQILRACADEHMAIIADCYMPDHLHLLVEAEAETSDCLTFISRAKQFSGFHFHKQFGERLWQRYGYERVLRGDEGTLSVAHYIVENPPRAGLVKQASEYPFTQSSVYTLDEILEAIQLKRWRSG